MQRTHPAATTLRTLTSLLLLLLTPAATTLQAQEEELTRNDVLAEFQKTAMAPENESFLFTTGAFPNLRWEHPFLVREAWGSVLPLNVKWFYAEDREVTRAEQPGRYAAFIEAHVPDGPVIRRSYTFFAFDQAEMAQRLQQQPFLPPMDLPFTSMFDVDAPIVLDMFREYVEELVTQAFVRQEKGAILLAAATELESSTDSVSPMDHPLIRHQEHHLSIRRSLQGVEDAYPPLRRPLLRDEPAPVLRQGYAAEAGFDDDLPKQLQALCDTWLRESGEPFTLVVARRGVIVFHEAFGSRHGNEVTRNTAYPLFSITKSLTGMMIAQFLDQGLLDLDSPIGEVLNDFPTEGDNAITLRDCLMHVSGIEGQVAFGGIDNPWLDNVIANGWETHQMAYAYSGVAYDLAGFAMQMVSGKSVPRLFHEHLFTPLGMKNARLTGLGMGGHLRAIDLARLGQMLLNRGTYGRHTFFHPETYEQLLPRSYAELYPHMTIRQNDYGLGIRHAGESHPHAGEHGLPEDATILSPNTLGHGSFSGTLFRVDPDQEIVIAMGRFASGEHHGEFVRELLMLISDAVQVTH